MTNLIAPFRNFVNAVNKDVKLADLRNSFQIQSDKETNFRQTAEGTEGLL
jgi:hypothetical protein